ncbi:MAG TPA: 5-deoxy-glucuronate isomerase [Candidatus Lokiarchaeia archaeon]|nr:5-deoxy-glucuronate isomerase [Candidatus Lokiarchaeia archaeon]
MKIPAPEFGLGETRIVSMDELPWDDPQNAKMDFSIVRLDEGSTIAMEDRVEKLVLLMKGEVTFSWMEESSSEAVSERVRRDSLFDENPWCLSAPASTSVSITAESGNVELAIMETRNDDAFQAKLYSPSECASEMRGEGTMRGTSTRVVRTIFDRSNAPPESKFVIGEVITFPGKWSSYPPHHHPQPEIYHYRFLPENGFGVGFLGDEAVKATHGDTTTILDVVHSQVAAPGYAMWYLWVIRHLDDAPYGPESGTPIFEPEHTWVMDKDSEARIWPPEEH